MTGNPKDTDALISDYLASGGRIRRIPDAVPATPSEVLQYLETRGVRIEPAPGKTAIDPTKYRHDGQLLTWQRLVQLANVHRRRQRLPPLEPK